MNFFDHKFILREKKYSRNYDIEDSLYSKLEEISEIYDATVSELLNACLEELIKTQDITIYEKDENEIVINHSFLIRESNLIGIDKLKNQYGFSLNRLVNMAIRKVFNNIKEV